VWGGGATTALALNLDEDLLRQQIFGDLLLEGETPKAKYALPLPSLVEGTRRRRG